MENFFRRLTQNTYVFYTLLGCSNLSSDTVGIIGGTDNNGLYAAFVTSSGTANPVSSLPNIGGLFSAAISSSGSGIVGGQDGFGTAYAAIVSPSGTATSLPSLPLGAIYSVAINASGTGLIGGRSVVGMQPPYVAFVSPAGNVTAVSSLPTAGPINAVAINDSGTGLVGGEDNTGAFPAYAAFISPSGSVTSITPLPAPGQIASVAINNSGTGLIGGFGSDAYAAFVSSSGTINSLSPLPAGGAIQGVAINSSGAAIIGGSGSAGSAYAALVSSSGTLTSLSSLPAMGFIQGVAINSSGAAIIGGTDYAGLGPAYAALVSPAGTVTPLSSLPVSGVIHSVAINDFGTGLIGGEDFSGPAFAALVTPSGAVIPLSPAPSPPAGIVSVAMISSAVSLLSQVPTAGLSGNNLHLARYINTNAPQLAFYFVPAVFDGSLESALESVAPTRNALAIFTMDNNLFSLDSAFSRHSRNSRLRRRQILKTSPEKIAFSQQPELLLASNFGIRKSQKVNADPKILEHRYELWMDILGSLAYQKAQHQTPAFQPTTGAAVIAFDTKTSQFSRMGLGGAYAYSHIHEKKDAGHINLNQEYAFLYAQWDNTRLYFDVALWGGLFQTKSVRHIRVTAFDFKSKSHPKGWQLAPHFEMGYNFSGNNRKRAFEPFVMLDWVGNWEKSFKESGDNPFNMHQKKHFSSFLRSEVGARFYETIDFTTWRLSFEEKLSYVNKKPFEVGTIHAFIVGSPGSFTVETLTTPQNLGVGELALIFEPKNTKYPISSITYQGEFGSMYQSHTVALSLNWNF